MRGRTRRPGVREGGNLGAVGRKTTRTAPEKPGSQDQQSAIREGGREKRFIDVGFE
jgi:hypothetical protein